jgi:RNA polymerase sigma factor (sigma-70 family)
MNATELERRVGRAEKLDVSPQQESPPEAEPATLETLLARLSTGDDAAAAQAFLAYEPILRLVVRRQLSNRLRSKFDSTDIVQSVWCDLLRGFRAGAWTFPDADHLRAFLVQATRHRFLNRLRDVRRAVDREQPLPEAELAANLVSHEPRPSAVAAGDDLWNKLLALCPPAHRELLHLKRQGLTLAELAARTGLHPSSVRRILYDLAALVARQASDPDNVSDR